MSKHIVLTILDGWGLEKDSKGNAVTQANMEFVESLKKDYPWVSAHASGEWVGLPDGQMGNSEVGHIHLGAGRIKYESLSLINKAIVDKSFNKNKEILAAIEHAKKHNSALHLMGLFSDGGVHSHIKHMFEAVKVASENGLKEVYCHLFTDGRDTKPKVAIDYLNELYKVFKATGVGKVGSISGRFFAMDRDKRFERTAEAYNILTKRSIDQKFSDATAYINEQYANGKDDEGIIPAYNSSEANGYVKPNDAVIFTNFRPDRAIQMASIFTNKNFIGWQDDAFKNEEFLGDKIYFVSMMKYSDSVSSDHVAFQPIEVVNGLGEWLANHNKTQLRIAETEKIAHVTFFFDGGKDYFKNGLAKPDEIKLKNADLALIASPKVKTYDLKPEMSAVEITDELVKRIASEKYDVIVLNYANCDMVGHTGDLEAAIKAVKTIDAQLKRVFEVCEQHDATMIITADHGNAEIMIDKEGGPNKKHTSQLVPIIVTDKNIKLNEKDAAIADVAPTILEMIGLEVPSEMTQPSLIKK
ncbi:2,3-bisphosphoglycerate-independent phosphoglycerate mutase [Spiroplasma endosymbiont of Crioceris asparagi]|uniref:2,3-bisphosphoglycerate-independent phosphoglycerate mutase n=1 Tax=Spiroplasma endosymbiont of Crioceris asparagi TaxID=3066286 RepID=UPI0030D56B54